MMSTERVDPSTPTKPDATSSSSLTRGPVLAFQLFRDIYGLVILLTAAPPFAQLSECSENIPKERYAVKNIFLELEK